MTAGSERRRRDLDKALLGRLTLEDLGAIRVLSLAATGKADSPEQQAAREQLLAKWTALFREAAVAGDPQVVEALAAADGDPEVAVKSWLART